MDSVDGAFVIENQRPLYLCKRPTYILEYSKHNKTDNQNVFVNEIRERMASSLFFKLMYLKM